MATMKDLDKKLSNLSDVLRNLKNSKTGAGWDNRIHPDAKVEGESLSFATLAYLHEYGSLKGTSKEVPARKLFFTVLRDIEKSGSEEIKRIILTNLFKYGKIQQSKLQHELADYVKLKLETTMGDATKLLPNSDLVAGNKGGNRPLVDRGSLRDNIITKVER